MDKDGVSPWFRSLARNKKSVCIDLRTEQGRRYISITLVLLIILTHLGYDSLVKQLAQDADVLIENFKPGTMEKWGIGPGKSKGELLPHTFI